MCCSTEGELNTEGMDGESFEPKLDLRRRRFLKALFIRPAVVCEPRELSLSESDESDDESEELDELNMSLSIPGADSSSMMCCGVLRDGLEWI